MNCHILRNKRYKPILGSHNTFSYSITPQSDISPDSPETLRRLKWAKLILNPFICKWSKTQDLNVKDQLESGIRYLDVRVVIRDDQILIAHGLYGGELFSYLSEIHAFLNENPSEIVILDFQHFYNFLPENHNNLIRTLQDIFGTKLCQRNRPITFVTLNAMAQNGEQVFVTYRSNASENVSILWPAGALPTPWPNKIKCSDLIQFLNRVLEHRQINLGLVTQIVLTVDIKYVIRHLFMNLRKMAQKTNSRMMPWIRAQHAGQHGVNVVICDFIDESFVQSVVQLNH